MLNNLETRYQNALDYLYSYVDFSLTHQQNLSPENFDLTRMYALMEALSQPQQTYPSLHVAGSKGKGSVSAFCAAALQAQGYRVGLYTSPHLRDFEERIQVNGKSITRADLVEIIDEIKPYVDAIPRLTEAFYQVDGTLARSHDGTGLGLSLVKTFVEAHQGDLAISSNIGVGTRVQVVFPKTRVCAPSEAEGSGHEAVIFAS